MERQAEIKSIYETYSVRLFNISLRIVGDRFDAEEIMHDSLLEYIGMRKPDKIQDPARWMSAVCIRKSIDRLRQKKSFRKLIESCAITEEYIEEDFPDKPDIGKIKEAVASMPDHYRLILTLHLLEGLDYQEISEFTKIKEPAIRTLYMRGRRKLAEILKTYSYE